MPYNILYKFKDQRVYAKKRHIYSSKEFAEAIAKKMKTQGFQAKVVRIKQVKK